ncbi:MAG: DNA-3-methyladenine glycosylase [Deltaproteobacteria bacterium]|nr:DNA-3-methyladenine glycosylase [Deltaproteobacteria bacterium]
MKLAREFYQQDVLRCARACVGKVLVHRGPAGTVGGRIVETEAYRGEEDLACHAARGRTARTEAMYGPPGHVYMFLLYGMHWAFNIVVGPRDHPHAILIRALEPTVGVAVMARRRGLSPGDRRVANGPGKLCAALGLDRRHYGADLCAGPVELWEGAHGRVGRSPRINVDYAGAWAARPWRFFERGNPYVSVPPRD